MRRLNDQDGASAVIFALLLVPLLGFGALVLDVGQMYWEGRQLQNGADAAALAVAQDCAAGNCGDAQATGDHFANENANDAASDANVALPGNEGVKSVTVTTTTRASNGDTFLTHWLGGILGLPTSSFERSATAIWGPISASSTIPLTFSKCEWDFLTGGDPANLPTDVRVVYFHSSQTAAEVNTCAGDPANQDHPGGFGWLNPENSECEALIVNGQVGTDTGNNVPNECKDELDALVGQIVIMPLFDSVDTPQGNNAVYNIVGFGAVEITGFRFPSYEAPAGSPPCEPNDTCIAGRFVEYYDLGAEPDPEAIDLGATAVGLTG